MKYWLEITTPKTTYVSKSWGEKDHEDMLHLMSNIGSVEYVELELRTGIDINRQLYMSEDMIGRSTFIICSQKTEA